MEDQRKKLRRLAISQSVSGLAAAASDGLFDAVEERRRDQDAGEQGADGLVGDRLSAVMVLS